MPEVSFEAVFLQQGFFKRSQQRFIEVNYGAALPANKVMVMSLVGRVITKPASSKVCFRYQFQFFQQVQRPVHRGNVYIRVSGYYVGIHLVCADMVIATLNSFYYHQPLRRQAVSLFAQRTGDVPDMLHDTSPEYQQSSWNIISETERKCNYLQLQ